ncbi:peptidase M28 [Candidatus Koribacter versatilis Ellin345]|uniref:Peptidase M28 n=1 Tax=Koribacter versatilis (strain Ellin345) TaxID=204669 RepID=Q1IN68_KORVE|nr:M28 family metallopeptidase [Candidatus Koribacter versatilis]ABF41682.1 peptidase M28 [Candidatus Koribacter versatilis Ellin345]
MIVAGMILCALMGLGCNSQTKQATPTPSPQAQPEPPAQPQSVITETQPMPVPSNALKINADKAWQYNKEVVGFGSRAVNSEGHKKLENYLKTKLKNDNLEIDEFTSNAPIGQFTGRNYIAKFPGKKDGIIVIAGHYDTLYNLPKFVGANDGGSSTALPLAIADALRGKPNDGYSVWLLFTDAEEAFVDWNKNDDNLYGTKHLAQKWKQDGTSAKIKAFILVDMLGDADLDVDEDVNSTPALRKVVYQAATNLGYQSHFFQRLNAFEDDHRPFGKIGVPVVDILDINYGYNGSLHHSVEDTLDKESPKSLGISGDVVLETVRLLNQ